MHLARALVERGDEVALLSLLPTESYGDVMADLGIPVHHAPTHRLRAAGFVRFARRLMRTHRPDVAVSFLYQANVVVRLAARLAGVPAVISSFRNERFGHRGREVVLRVTDRLATCSTTNSVVVARSLVARKVTRDAVVVVRNGLDVASFDAAARRGPVVRAELAAGETFVWLAAGRLEPQKDHATLLRAFADHRRTAPRPVTLWLAGDGSLRPELEQLAAALGLGAQVRFLGIRSDLPAVLAAGDALVQSSAWEGLPNVVMEAMAARRPVVATDVGGTSELVMPGVTGLLTAPGDPDALARAMDRMVALSAADRRRWGDAGRAAIEEEFTVEAATRAWLTLIDSTIEGATNRRATPGVRS